MLVPDLDRCLECSHPLLDAEDELVCPGCGLVKEKPAAGVARAGGKLPLFGRQPLGSYMGAGRGAIGDRYSRVSGEGSSYSRIRRLSDCTREGSYAACGRLVERVGERLLLPRVAILQAASLARKIMDAPRRRRLTVAEVSAYSLVTACKIEGVATVSIREILDAFADLGKKVNSAAIFRLTLDSPVKTFARRPDEYIPRVIARLSMNRRLAGRLSRDGVLQAPYLDSLRRLAGEILAGSDRTQIDGKRPCALAASAVYMAELVSAAQESRNLRITQKECAECGDAAEYTVREQCATIFAAPVQRLTPRGPRSLPPQTAQ